MEFQLPEERTADAWQVYIWNLPDTVVSRPQKLQFMLMLEGAFNAFDPFVVVADLLKHRDLWHGVVMDRGFLLPEGHGPAWARMATDLIKLRDIGEGYWNVDTLFILTRADDATRWPALVEGWNADEVHVIEGPDLSHVLGWYGGEDQFRIVRIWWD